MPTFSRNGNDEYICQKCARVFDSVEQPSQWRPDITGHNGAGTCCPTCVHKHNQPRAVCGGWYGLAYQRRANEPTGLLSAGVRWLNWTVTLTAIMVMGSPLLWLLVGID